MKQPSEKAINAAAQLWCQPQHEKKEMDPDFAISIAHALDAFAAEAVKAEREACVQIVLGEMRGIVLTHANVLDLAAAIRARGKE